MKTTILVLALVFCLCVISTEGFVTINIHFGKKRSLAEADMTEEQKQQFIHDVTPKIQALVDEEAEKLDHFGNKRSVEVPDVDLTEEQRQELIADLTPKFERLVNEEGKRLDFTDTECLSNSYKLS